MIIDKVEKLVCDTEAEIDALLAWMNTQLGYPIGDITTYANKYQRAVDNKWFIPKVTDQSMTGSPTYNTGTPSTWDTTWIIPVTPDPEAPNYIIVSTQTVSTTKTIITEDTAWQFIGEVPGNPGALVKDLSKTIGSIVFRIETNGATVKVRITEDDVLVGTEQTLPDSNSVNCEHRFYLPPPTYGSHVYRLEAKLDGSTSAKIGSALLVLLEDVNQ